MARPVSFGAPGPGYARSSVRNNELARGRFITLEGGEGVGKSTQALALSRALTARGLVTVTTREPGGTPNAEAIRTLLMTGSAERWSARAEVLLFAAARADHVGRVIEPALASGTWVICDRFIDSSRAYQVMQKGMSDDDVMTIHSIGSGGILPDRTLLLMLDPAQGLARARQRDGRDDRFAARDSALLRDRFTEMAAAEPGRFKAIDANGTVGQVTARVTSAIEDLLA